MLFVLALILLWYRVAVTREPSARRETYRRAMRYAFRVLYFGYPLVSPVVVSIFICHSVAGVSYLETDFRVVCGTTTWWWAVAWSIVWTAGYVIGFPVLVVWGTRRRLIAKLKIRPRQPIKMSKHV